jgi:hypothetical protein
MPEKENFGHESSEQQQKVCLMDDKLPVIGLPGSVRTSACK